MTPQGGGRLAFHISSKQRGGPCLSAEYPEEWGSRTFCLLPTQGASEVSAQSEPQEGGSTLRLI